MVTSSICNSHRCDYVTTEEHLSTPFPQLHVGSFLHPTFARPGAVWLSNFQLFPSLHRDLASHWFRSDKEVKARVYNYFTKLGRIFNAEGIAKLVKQYSKCLNSYCEYVKKWIWIWIFEWNLSEVHIFILFFMDEGNLLIEQLL